MPTRTTANWAIATLGLKIIFYKHDFCETCRSTKSHDLHIIQVVCIDQGNLPLRWKGAKTFCSQFFNPYNIRPHNEWYKGTAHCNDPWYDCTCLTKLNGRHNSKRSPIWWWHILFCQLLQCRFFHLMNDEVLHHKYWTKSLQQYYFFSKNANVPTAPTIIRTIPLKLHITPCVVILFKMKMVNRALNVCAWELFTFDFGS